MDKRYVDTVRLLLEAAPAIFESPDFAMKGGTAINLFVRDMPRLSIDIDVVYTDHRASRPDALQSISTYLERAQAVLALAGMTADVASTKTGDEFKLFVRRGAQQVKIEVNHVFRGTILPVEHRRLGAQARRLFTTDLNVPVLANPELFGSKLVAAFDRQHPRDLFDVLGLVQNDGLTPEVVECFVCYLAGHNRPVHEVLFSRDLDLSQAFNNEFIGMTREPAKLEDLVEVRRRLRRIVDERLTTRHREFLLSLVTCEPEWGLMNCPHLANLPALRWKLENLEKLKRTNPTKFRRQASELGTRFEL